MKAIKQLLSLILIVSIYSNSFGQTSDLLEALPQTKEEFVTSEKKILATINWLETTPLDQETDKRQIQKALLIAWITNSPTVTIEVNANVLTFTKKNTDMIVFFLGGWTKYCLENSYSKDAVKGSLAGIRSAMKVYKKNIGIKKDKEMQKLIDLEDKGDLDKWVESQLVKK